MAYAYSWTSVQSDEDAKNIQRNLYPYDVPHLLINDGNGEDRHLLNMERHGRRSSSTRRRKRNTIRPPTPLISKTMSEKSSRMDRRYIPNRTPISSYHSDSALPSIEARVALQTRHGRRHRDGAFTMEEVSTDKPVASQAVAFVIRASRRGVIPLCAEVANLIKETNSLEDTVNQQKQELDELREEVLILREAVKGPPPVMVDVCFQTIQETDCQTMTVDESCTQTDTVIISCIRNENIESLKHDRPGSSDVFRSNGVNGTAPTRVTCKGVEAACGSQVMTTCSCSQLTTTATQNPTMISIGVNTLRDDCMDSVLGYFEHTSLEKSHRELEQKHSNMIGENKNMGKMNEILDKNLNSAKEEIVTLQKAIQEMQNKEYERERQEEMMRQHETYSVDVQDSAASSDDDGPIKPRAVKSAPGKQRQMKLLPLLTADTTSVTRPSSASSSIFPGPILGCKCQMCTAFFRSSGILGFACSPYVTDSAGKNPVLRDLKKLVWLQNSKLQIQPKDHIIARNNRMGTVRYVGHLDGVGTPSVVYIGLELENQEGRHDGYLHGKRYFFCLHKHGLFIPLQDVICVINRKVTPPSAHAPVRSKPPAITGMGSSGKISSVALSEFRRRRRPKTISESASDSSTTTESSMTSSTRSGKSARSAANRRLPPVVVTS